MGTAKGPVKRERIEARVTAEEKEIVQRAAALNGSSLTDFVMRSALDAARETIRAHQVIELTVRDSRAFAQALIEAPEPNENLRALAQRYDEFVSG
jgi:uncharacterized protein (DUF1778 family)